MAASDQSSSSTPSRGRQPGEPDDPGYPLTTGIVRPRQRPGGLPGSTSGAQGDRGRDGLANLGDAANLIAPHTGY